MQQFAEFELEFRNELSQSAEVTIKFWPRREYPGSPTEAADAFVTSLGFAPLGELWRDLDNLDRSYDGVPKTDPVGHLAAFLQRDPMFSSEWLSPDRARECSGTFYGLFNRRNLARLTNFLGYGWNPITRSTLDAAYISMDNTWIGLLLFQAED